jgi:hypothetical protein
MKVVRQAGRWFQWALFIKATEKGALPDTGFSVFPRDGGLLEDRDYF